MLVYALRGQRVKHVTKSLEKLIMEDSSLGPRSGSQHVARCEAAGVKITYAEPDICGNEFAIAISR